MQTIYKVHSLLVQKNPKSKKDGLILKLSESINMIVLLKQHYLITFILFSLLIYHNISRSLSVVNLD